VLKRSSRVLAPKKPLWFHFQECAIDMVRFWTRSLLVIDEYPKVAKGRESYYRLDAGITILEAKLVNVKHMLNNDTSNTSIFAG